MAASSLEALQQEQPVDQPIEVRWRSFELRPKGAPPLTPEYRAKIEANRPRLYAIAEENYGIAMEPGPFGFDSRPALIGAKYAEAMGKDAAYNKRVLVAYWEEAANIEDREILADQAEASGLERSAFLAALDDPTYVEQVEQDIALAQAYGLSGVPAMVFQQQYLVSGAQPLPVLRQVVDQVRQG